MTSATWTTCWAASAISSAADTAQARGGAPAAPTISTVPVTITLEEAFSGTKREVNVPTGGGGSRRIEVTIPPAVDTGSRVHIGLADGTQVFLAISVATHVRFRRDGDNLHAELAAPFEDAALGGEVEFTSLKGRLALTIPPDSGEGRRIRIQGHGMPCASRRRCSATSMSR